MKLCYPEIENVFSFSDNKITTLVLENPRLFREFIYDLFEQSQGSDGKAVFSINDSPVSFAKNTELFTTFTPFDINTKALLAKIQGILEKTAVSSENYLSTQNILLENEKWLTNIAEELPCEIEASKLNHSTLIKAFGISIRDDSESLCEKLLNYMELVRELDRDKLFIFINLRSYIEDSQLSLFFDSVIKHGFKIFLIDSSAKNILPFENRTVIDEDLCEF